MDRVELLKRLNWIEDEIEALYAEEGGVDFLRIGVLEEEAIEIHEELNRLKQSKKNGGRDNGDI